VVHNGKLTAAAYGEADAEGTPLTRETSFRVGSISKSFIATMILQLVDEGKVELDQPLGAYLPDLPVGAGVTIRQLLSHMSGIPNYTSNPAFFADVVDDFSHTYEPEEILSFVDGFVVNEPGAFEYSNTNYILLGMLLTHIDGTSINESLQQRIAEPLGLANTVFVGHGVDEPDGLVSFWSFGLNTGLTNVEYESIASGAWAAGALVSTVDELATFLTSLFDGDLISAQTLAQMTDTGASGYGLGLFAARLGDNEPGYAHNGAIPGFSSTMGISQESGDMIIVLTNNDVLTADQVAPQIFSAW
jgi:D-alanyl-D-alanine carboxypeptidase